MGGSGDSFTSKVRVDKDFPITQNWDVTTGVSCDYTKLKRSCSSHHKPETIYVMEGTTAKPVELPPVSSPKYSGNIFSLGTKVMPTYTTSNGKFTVGLGASAHYVAHDIPATLHCEQGDCSQPIETGVKNNNNFLFSPEGFFRTKLFDDGENCLNFDVEANRSRGTIRLSFCF